MMIAADNLLPIALFGLGTPELIVIALVLVLLFGASRIPQLGKSVGTGIRNFKKGLAEGEDEEDDEDLESADSSPKRIAEDAEVTDAKVIESKSKRSKQKA